MDKKNTEHTIQGNILVSGSGQGKALVLSEPLSLWGGLDPDTGEIIDRRHPQSGDVVTDRILVLPSGRGSSSASSILLEAIRAGTAPAAIIHTHYRRDNICLGKFGSSTISIISYSPSSHR